MSTFNFKKGVTATMTVNEFLAANFASNNVRKDYTQKGQDSDTIIPVTVAGNLLPIEVCKVSGVDTLADGHRRTASLKEALKKLAEKQETADQLSELQNAKIQIVYLGEMSQTELETYQIKKGSGKTLTTPEKVFSISSYKKSNPKATNREIAALFGESEQRIGQLLKTADSTVLAALPDGDEIFSSLRSNANSAKSEANIRVLINESAKSPKVAALVKDGKISEALDAISAEKVTKPTFTDTSAYRSQMMAMFIGRAANRPTMAAINDESLIKGLLLGVQFAQTITPDGWADTSEIYSKMTVILDKSSDQFSEYFKFLADSGESFVKKYVSEMSAYKAATAKPDKAVDPTKEVKDRLGKLKNSIAGTIAAFNALIRKYNSEKVKDAANDTDKAKNKELAKKIESSKAGLNKAKVTQDEINTIVVTAENIEDSTKKIELFEATNWYKDGLEMYEAAKAAKAAKTNANNTDNNSDDNSDDTAK